MSRPSTTAPRHAERTLTLAHQGPHLRVTGDVRHLTPRRGPTLSAGDGGRTLDLELRRACRSTGRTSTSTSVRRATGRRPGRRPASSAASVSARYMIPVFTYGRPSASARPRASVLLPEPAAPSIAMTRSVVTSQSSTDAPSARMASTNPGNDTSAASMPSISLGAVRRERRDRERHREAMVASRCRRSRPGAPGPAPRGRRPPPPRARPAPGCPSATPASRSLSLRAELGGAREPRLPARVRRERAPGPGPRRSRAEAPTASTSVPTSSAPGATHRSPTGSPSSSRVPRVSVSHAHPRHHLEEVQPARVEPDAARRSAPSRSARPPRRGTRRTKRRPGTGACERLVLVHALERDRRPSTDTGAPRAASARSVWSRVAAGSVDRRLPFGRDAGEQDRALHLGAWGRAASYEMP